MGQDLEGEPSRLVRHRGVAGKSSVSLHLLGLFVWLLLFPAVLFSKRAAGTPSEQTQRAGMRSQGRRKATLL